MTTSFNTLSSQQLARFALMAKPPETLYYCGNTELLERKKVSIVGSRNPNPYTRQMTAQLAVALAKRGVCVVSGAAMGVDAIAHKNAGPSNTIAVMANGLDIRYPVVNKKLIESIENEGLVLSQFAVGEKARPWSFVVRNEVVVALGDVLIVTQADRNSGTMHSVDFAKAMRKPIFVLSHRIGDSEGSNALLADGTAEGIYDIEAFCDQFGESSSVIEGDALLEACRNGLTYEEAFRRFGETLFAYELEGKIRIEHSKVFTL